MAKNKVDSQARMAIVAVLKDKYLGKLSSPDAATNNLPPATTLPPTTQEVSNVALHPKAGEGIGGQTKHSSVVEGPANGEASVMESVDRCITASLKPSLMANEEEESRAIEGQLVNTVPANTRRTSPHDLAIQQRNRGRWLAVVMRIEFDPMCLNLSYKEKAVLAGLDDLCGDDEGDLVFQYTSILNDMEFVTSRKKALEAFESEMDVPTAVCIAQASKRDPQFAIMRRRLRQMDERYRVGGDQREQFGQIMAFLRGEEYNSNNGGNGNVAHEIEGVAGNNDEAEAEPAGLSVEADGEPV